MLEVLGGAGLFSDVILQGIARQTPVEVYRIGSKFGSGLPVTGGRLCLIFSRWTTEPVCIGDSPAEQPIGYGIF